MWSSAAVYLRRLLMLTLLSCLVGDILARPHPHPHPDPDCDCDEDYTDAYGGGYLQGGGDAGYASGPAGFSSFSGFGYGSQGGYGGGYASPDGSHSSSFGVGYG